MSVMTCSHSKCAQTRTGEITRTRAIGKIERTAQGFSRPWRKRAYANRMTRTIPQIVSSVFPTAYVTV
jgi:hypothetical protein